MTTSSGTVQVLGVLVDPAQLFLEGISPGQTVHKAVQSIWETFCEQVGKDITPETTFPSTVQVLLGEINPFTHFKVVFLVTRVKLGQPSQDNFLRLGF